MFLTSFRKLGWKPELCASKLRYLEKFWKKWKLTKNCHSELFKNQRCSELFQRKSALFSSESALFQKKSALKQRWFLALRISVFSAVQSWISAVQRFSGNEQRWTRPESILNQSWSALNVSETSTRVASDVILIGHVWSKNNVVDSFRLLLIMAWLPNDRGGTIVLYLTFYFLTQSPRHYCFHRC